ncbi:PhnA protein [Methylovorus sp. MM2]|uniref:alkylphosphonate utilization protein n=1 Tax=Methylovorus sp. MM2 TaxID=1848038 RepID=UPI0007E160E4|nr:alkylphosphonate utilization protein [Methylovorus sp. MM2]OAM52037.1 PhnA protein [Methylovorus sp. MM2]
MSAKDSNGNELNEGDAVQVIKDLKVKGSSITLKRGKVFKSIHLTEDDEEVECREGKTTIVLKTCFLKKV